MIWGCITYHGVGTLCRVIGNINSEKYVDIFDNNLWPVIARHFPDNNYMFMDDNAPVHRSIFSTNYKTNNNIIMLEWPAQSPDLNPTENVWLAIKRKLQSHIHRINTAAELFEKISEIWTSFTVEYIKSLYVSLPKRVRRVQQARGYITKY
jgi:transposase